MSKISENLKKKKKRKLKSTRNKRIIFKSFKQNKTKNQTTKN